MLGHLLCEVLGGAVVVDAIQGLVDGDDAGGAVAVDKFMDGDGFGFGKSGVAEFAVVASVGGGEVAVEVDAAAIEAAVVGDAIGISDGQDYQLSAGEKM